eukprot:1038184_1
MIFHIPTTFRPSSSFFKSNSSSLFQINGFIAGEKGSTGTVKNRNTRHPNQIHKNDPLIKRTAHQLYGPSAPEDQTMYVRARGAVSIRTRTPKYRRISDHDQFRMQYQFVCS